MVRILCAALFTSAALLGLIYSGHPLLHDWNGTSFFISPCLSHLSNLQVCTDAAGTTSFGAYLDGLWFTKQLSTSIVYTELYPTVLALHVWANRWQGLDSVPLEQLRGNWRHLQMFLLWWASLGHSFWVSATQIPGGLNSIADALSFAGAVVPYVGTPGFSWTYPCIFLCVLIHQNCVCFTKHKFCAFARC